MRSLYEAWMSTTENTGGQESGHKVASIKPLHHGSKQARSGIDLS